ncbi:Peroxiredoxin-like 2C [Pseudocercospora fuligena]|uniref:Peroxiredoxin-like 2C n=1 Tax=Pseudocercospora fuligena TaxID=685502 RepID=A0A8H6RS06_9PEZI|nr:Peroxiredoxin-like 2C [Pseudocercospora fuligena]
MGSASANEKSHRELPSPQTLAQAGDLKIKDKDGNEIPFKDLYTGKADNERQLIIFIRHFFCGSCEQYVMALSKDLSPAALQASNTSITLIGCGEPKCIPGILYIFSAQQISPTKCILGYIERTSCPYPTYTNPSASIYKALGMTYITIKTGPNPQPTYLQKPFFKNVLDSMWNGIVSGHPLSAGPSAQNGGEW